MIKINEALLGLLEQRRKTLINHFGKNKHTITLEAFVNRVLQKKVEDWRKEVDDNNDNKGLQWEKFKRKHGAIIYRRDKGYCYYCQKRLTRGEATLDHKLSHIRGGTNVIENCVLSCGWCNQDKGILTAEEYRYKQLHNTAQGIHPPE